MSFSKITLIRRVGDALAACGYRQVPESTSGALAVFYRTESRLLLTFGLEKSKLYTGAYTGSFYLSRSFEWGFMPRGLPGEAYARVGEFLREDERRDLLSEVYSRPGVVDAWWVGTEGPVLDAFIQAVIISEPRFLVQPGMIGAVAGCSGLVDHGKLVVGVIDYLQTHNIGLGDLDGLRRVAENCIRSVAPERVNAHYIDLIARDSRRFASLLSESERLLILLPAAPGDA